jgi:hypothetical protein
MEHDPMAQDKRAAEAEQGGGRPPREREQREPRGEREPRPAPAQ